MLEKTNPLKMNDDLLLKILNYRANKISYSVTERKTLLKSYRVDLQKKLLKSANLLEGIIDKINND